MKNAIEISVKKPCSEKFENFQQISAGGFCGSCQKEVIDFTMMTSEELQKHFSNSSEKTCGRFKVSQLKTYEPIMKNNTSTNFVSRGIAVMSFSLLSLCAISNMQAQNVASNNPSIKTEVNISQQPIVMGKIAVDNYTATGTVVDEENLPLAGVNVVLKGTTVGTQTDFDGKFEFPETLEVDDVLVFSYIGYGKKEYTITAVESETIEINITFDLSDIELMGDVVIGGAYATKRNVFQKFIALFK